MRGETRRPLRRRPPEGCSPQAANFFWGVWDVLRMYCGRSFNDSRAPKKPRPNWRRHSQWRGKGPNQKPSNMREAWCLFTNIETARCTYSKKRPWEAKESGAKAKKAGGQGKAATGMKRAIWRAGLQARLGGVCVLESELVGLGSGLGLYTHGTVGLLQGRLQGHLAMGSMAIA